MRRRGMLAALTAFAASPQGRRIMNQAKNYVRSPEGKAKIAGMRAQATDAVRKQRATRGGQGTSSR